MGLSIIIMGMESMDLMIQTSPLFLNPGWCWWIISSWCLGQSGSCRDLLLEELRWWFVPLDTD